MSACSAFVQEVIASRGVVSECSLPNILPDGSVSDVINKVHHDVEEPSSLIPTAMPTPKPVERNSATLH